jgi:hypothetical protein
MKHNTFPGLILLLTFIILTSCDFNAKSSEPETSVLENLVDIKVGNYESMSSKAAAILEYRYKEEGMESYAALEMDRWFYEFKAFGSEISPCENGEFVDFYPDLTYDYGTKDGKLGGGKYHYNIETGKVLLVDNNSKVKPREYLAKISGPSMVLQGETTYGDNVFQAKLMMDNINKTPNVTNF